MLGATVLVATGGLAAPRPAAARPSVTHTAFKASECDRRVYDSPLNGVDAFIFDVAPRAGQFVIVRASSNGIGTPVYFVYDADCEPIGKPAVAVSGMRLPLDAAWLVVEGASQVAVS